MLDLFSFYRKINVKHTHNISVKTVFHIIILDQMSQWFFILDNYMNFRDIQLQVFFYQFNPRTFYTFWHYLENIKINEALKLTVTYYLLNLQFSWSVLTLPQCFTVTSDVLIFYGSRLVVSGSKIAAFEIGLSTLLDLLSWPLDLRIIRLDVSYKPAHHYSELGALL